MQGKRKLIAFAILVASLMLAGWLKFISPELVNGMLGGFIAIVGGNAAEHWFNRNKQGA